MVSVSRPTGGSGTPPAVRTGGVAPGVVEDEVGFPEGNPSFATVARVAKAIGRWISMQPRR